MSGHRHVESGILKQRRTLRKHDIKVGYFSLALRANKVEYVQNNHCKKFSCSPHPQHVSISEVKNISTFAVFLLKNYTVFVYVFSLSNISLAIGTRYNFDTNFL